MNLRYKNLLLFLLIDFEELTEKNHAGLTEFESVPVERIFIPWKIEIPFKLIVSSADNRCVTMNGQTLPKLRTGSNFGTLYSFLVRELLIHSVVPIFLGPVRGPDFDPDSNLVLTGPMKYHCGPEFGPS